MRPAIIIILLSSFVFTACATDPRKQAEAEIKLIQAQQSAADAEQQRQQQDARHIQNMQDREATQRELQAAMKQVIRTTALLAEFAISLILLGAGVCGVWGMHGTTRAYTRWVEVRANLIPLDPKTRQYPLFLQYIGRGQYTLTNPNANSTLVLDTRNEPDRAMIISAANVEHSGALAHEARLSHKPGEISRIPAVQVIEMESAA